MQRRGGGAENRRGGAGEEKCGRCDGPTESNCEL